MKSLIRNSKSLCYKQIHTLNINFNKIKNIQNFQKNEKNLIKFSFTNKINKIKWK